MQIVTEAALGAQRPGARRREKSQAQFDSIVQMFEAQADAFYTAACCWTTA